jgi:hypothetical protein
MEIYTFYEHKFFDVKTMKSKKTIYAEEENVFGGEASIGWRIGAKFISSHY